MIMEHALLMRAEVFLIAKQGLPGFGSKERDPVRRIVLLVDRYTCAVCRRRRGTQGVINEAEKMKWLAESCSMSRTRLASRYLTRSMPSCCGQSGRPSCVSSGLACSECMLHAETAHDATRIPGSAGASRSGRGWGRWAELRVPDKTRTPAAFGIRRAHLGRGPWEDADLVVGFPFAAFAVPLRKGGTIAALPHSAAAFWQLPIPT
jgi:hypothetical protein